MTEAGEWCPMKRDLARRALGSDGVGGDAGDWGESPLSGRLIVKMTARQKYATSR